jgi:hypothetical protein
MEEFTLNLPVADVGSWQALSFDMLVQEHKYSSSAISVINY